MEVYAGLDLHATNTYVAMIDAENKVLYKQRHRNEVPAILSALDPFKKDIQGVVDKVVEEVQEFRQAGSAHEKSDEFGDMLFTLVNFARRQGIDSENALREANARFFRRFTYMEKLCRARGLKFPDLSFDEQNRLWDEAKKASS